MLLTAPTALPTETFEPARRVVSVVPAREEAGRFADLIVEASSDPAFRNTSIPSVTSRGEALEWLLAHPQWTVQLVLVDGLIAGYVALHPPCLTEERERFADHVETETYLLPVWRGCGLAAEAWSHALPTLPAGTRLVAETWADNVPAQRRLLKEGWTPVGTYWWQHATRSDISGLCCRFERHLP